ncbi:ArdC family protein [Microbacterium sp. C7(2022)]|uniref:ArdC family protein n=1 Tax=Microbacterium sp. C7(2022) TaxID=2992759 RepID=UPI00237A6C3B|nr:ArdC family protein [Microbacterium sp. C7(2022)]MDE0545930.1 ArdC-like ssDNA-binding domain-containing protein [Microbacterium sp. C7(2022)]
MTDEQRAGSNAEEKLREVHERLARAVEELTSGDEWRRALEFAARFRTRSFGNCLLIWAQHSAAYEQGLVPEPLPTFVAGFRQWQQLGHQVLKGQRGYAILAPITGNFATKTPNDPMSWRRLRRGERPGAGEVVRSRLIGVKPAHVWDISQTSGPPAPRRQLPELLKGEAPDGLWNELARLVESDGFTLSSVADSTEIGGANGRTDFLARTVVVRADMDAAARVRTLTHELAHIRLHGPDHEAISHRGIGEVEAESVALMVGAAHGMDTSIYTIPYVASWASTVNGKTVAEVVQDTGERVRRAAVEILDALTTTKADLGHPSVQLERGAPDAHFRRPADRPVGREAAGRPTWSR